jgi:hypothetical protein
MKAHRNGLCPTWPDTLIFLFPAFGIFLEMKSEVRIDHENCKWAGLGAGPRKTIRY